MQSKDKLLNGIIVAVYLAALIFLGSTGMNLISLSEKGTEDSRLIGASYMTMNNEFYDIINEQIRVSMLSMGISALIVTPVTADGLSDVLDRAQRLGVRVIVVDTELDRDGQADCTIVSDNFRAGYMIGEYMMKQQESGSCPAS